MSESVSERVGVICGKARVLSTGSNTGSGKVTIISRHGVMLVGMDHLYEHPYEHPYQL